MSVRFLVATLVLTAACVLVPPSVATSADLAPIDSDLLQKIAEAAREREALFSGPVIQGETTTTRVVVHRANRKEPFEQTRTEKRLRYSAEGLFLIRTVEGWEKDDLDAEPRQAALIEGTKATVLYHKYGQGPQARIDTIKRSEKREQIARGAITSVHMGGNFLISELASGDVNVLRGLFPEDSAWGNLEHYSIQRTASTIIDGRECHTFRLVLVAPPPHDDTDPRRYEATVSFDQEHGWAIETREFALRTDEAGKVTPVETKHSEVLCSQFKEFAGGVWLPMRRRSTSTDLDANARKHVTDRRFERLEFPASIPAEMFKLDLPPGTLVDDRIAGIQYRTPEPLALDEILVDDFDVERLLDEAAPLEPLTVLEESAPPEPPTPTADANAPDEKDEHSRLPIVSLLVAAVVVVSAALWLLWVRRGRQVSR